MNSEQAAVIWHYDLLIDGGNDPVNDPEPLRRYMDKWDGQPFLDALQLTKEKSVLEIGVGTGRLGVRVAPLCGTFFGIDMSPKTIRRVKDNLQDYGNVTLICADFAEHVFRRRFDVIYSTLTFMHIRDKQAALCKVGKLLNDGGRFILSIDKNQSGVLRCGEREIRVYPDSEEETVRYIQQSGMQVEKVFETAFAHIFTAIMPSA